MRAILRAKSASGRKPFVVAGDVSKAHRRIKIRKEDWGFQACRLRAGKVWLNRVGTYGMTPASYHWARASAAAIVRLTHYLLGAGFPLELLLYSDDFIFAADTKPQVEAIGFAIFFVALIGIPFRWKKFRGGTEINWIGYWIDFRAFRLGISLCG